MHSAVLLPPGSHTSTVTNHKAPFPHFIGQCRSIWDAESEASSEASADELQAVDAPHTSAAARVSPVAAPTKLGSAASRTTPVTVQPVATPPGQQTSMADQVGWAGERAVAPKGYEMRREAYDLSAHPR